MAGAAKRLVGVARGAPARTATSSAVMADHTLVLAEVLRVDARSLCLVSGLDPLATKAKDN